jgi:hypothetical protein
MAGLGSDREAGGGGLSGRASCSHFVIWPDDGQHGAIA